MEHGLSGEAMVPDAGPFRRRARRSRRVNFGIGVAAAAAFLILAGLSWWYRFGAQPPVDVVAMPRAPAAEENAAAAPAAPPAIRHPVPAVPPPVSWEDALAQGLAGLFGGRTPAWPLQQDGIVNRFVATIDNLDRIHASPMVWPVVPAPRRFVVESRGNEHFVGADNGQRYAGFVQLVEQVDPQRAVALYTRLYPLFQQAYEELGYPGRYFNDRLVDVIDHLLEAPEPAGPVAVSRIDVRGPMDLAQPWRHYEFVDPELQSLSAGQKLMVRVGPVNERRLKARLQAVRAALLTRAPGG